MTIKTIGLIGVGLMGHGIGKNILAKGFELRVLAHKNRAPVESLMALGAVEISDIAAWADRMSVRVSDAHGADEGPASIAPPGVKLAAAADPAANPAPPG